jgi:hypothetical protein
MALGKSLERLRRDLIRSTKRAAFESQRRAAVRVVNDLKSLGPYWAGYFELAWVVELGDVSIPATQEGTPRMRDSKSRYAPRPPVSPMKLSDIPDLRLTYKSKVPTLTIGNLMKYRDIALDLVPGRLKDEEGGTAPQDWYLTYYGGGGFDNAVRGAIDELILIPDK